MWDGQVKRLDKPAVMGLDLNCVHKVWLQELYLVSWQKRQAPKISGGQVG